jgi:peptide/nickel transport system permease protein
MATREEALIIPALEKPLPPVWLRALKSIWFFTRRKPMGAFGALILILTIAVAIFSPWIARFPYEEAHFADSLIAPNSTYWFGTNQLGQDLFSRMVIGAQVTVLAGLGTVLLSAIISIVVGGLSGYLGGRVDMITQRVVDIWVALPPIFLLLTFVAVLGTGGDGFLGIGRGPDDVTLPVALPVLGRNIPLNLDPRDGDWIWYTFFRSTVVIFSLGIIFAGYNSRIIRGAVLAIKENVYIEAARALGATDTRIMLTYVLPNILPVVIILATLNLGVAVLAEATISFLGFGIQAPFPTWGQLLAKEGRVHGPGHEYLMIIPGVAIFISVYGFNMFGDALRDLLDPRLRGSR